MAQFTTHITAEATPEQVLRVLTDPDEIRAWSPIPFEVEDLDGALLAAGSQARVFGNLAGLRAAAAARGPRRWPSTGAAPSPAAWGGGRPGRFSARGPWTRGRAGLRG